LPAWREIYGQSVAKLEFEPEPGEELFAEAALRQFPGLSVVSMASTGLHFRKSPSLLGDDGYILAIIDSGRWTGSQLGREAHLEAGDAVLCTNGEVARGLTFGRRVLFRVSASALTVMVPDVNARVLRRIPRDAPGLALLRQYLRVLHDGEVLASTTVQRTAVAHVHDLLALTLGTTRDAAVEAEARGGRAARLHAIKDDIARHFEYGDVSLGAVAARHRMTTRYVQKLFETEGTSFGDYVLNQRLAHAHRLLSDPRHAAEKVASVALAAGFGDVSYFYRAFRRRYGTLPADVRAQARH
jgi:AraC-like DNA-binding protein